MKHFLVDIGDKYYPRGKALDSILDSLLQVEFFKERVTAITYDLTTFFHCKRITINDVDVYHKSEKKKISLNKKIYRAISFANRVLYILIGSPKYHLYKKIYKNSYFDELLMITYTKNDFKSLLRFNRKFNVPFTIVLVDPLSVSPLYNEKEKLKISLLESQIIKKCHSYFIPQGWYDSYKHYFSSKKIKEFYFPLITSKYIKQESWTATPTFIHLGSIHKGRETHLAASFFEERDMYLNVFGSNHLKNHNKAFIFHEREEDIDKVIGEYSFLVLLDNVGKIKDFLPSKLITYINSCKPIVIFGHGNNYTEKFISGYPLFFYCKNKNDFEKLDIFLKANINSLANRDIVMNKYKNNINDNCAKELVMSMD